MKKARISQQQIAKDLGLSQTLVSMVLNGRRQGVSKESYEQIWDHARRSGYRPKGMATELLGEVGKVRSVGYVLRTGVKLYSQSPFFGHVQHGLHDFLAEHRISLVLLGIENHLDVETLKGLYRDRSAFLGLVVLGEVARPFLHALKKLDPRIVTVSAQYPGLCHSVVSNEEQSAEFLVQHLMDLGHRNFAWLGGNRGLQRSRSRLEAVTSALRLRDVVIDPKFMIDLESGDRLEGNLAADAILKASAGAKNPPTAWICFNGTMARGAVNKLLQTGIRIPEDISVCAFDRTRVSEEEHPTITGANTPPELIGRVAGEMLLNLEQNPENRFFDTVLASELAVLESTATVPRKVRLRNSSLSKPVA